MARRTRVLVAVLLASVVAWPCVARAGSVSMEAKEKDLAAVLDLMASHGGPRLTPHPDAAKEPFSFAAKQLARNSAVRWLCRSCGLAAVKGEGGGTVVGKPAINEAELKQYKVAPLFKEEDDAEALLRFLRKVIIAAFEHREEADGKAKLPEAEIILQDGKLKVLAPAVVHKEIVALFQAMAKVKERGNTAQMAVKYASSDLGYFRASTGAKPPSMKGKVTFGLEEALAAEAAGELTTHSETSVYIDAFDPALAKAKVSMVTTDKPLDFAAGAVAKALNARLMAYDGAWLIVRAARKPLYDGLVVRVYHVGGTMPWGGGSIGDMILRRARGLEVPEGLPYAIELVGDRLIACVPAEMHKQIEGFTQLRRPGDRDGRDGRDGRFPWGGRPGGRGGPGGGRR